MWRCPRVSPISSGSSVNTDLDHDFEDVEYESDLPFLSAFSFCFEYLLIASVKSVLLWVLGVCGLPIRFRSGGGVVESSRVRDFLDALVLVFFPWVNEMGAWRGWARL
jgi:hypothetical protein